MKKPKGTLHDFQVTAYQRDQIMAMIASTKARLLAVDPDIQNDKTLWSDTLEGESDVTEVLREIGRKAVVARSYKEHARNMRADLSASLTVREKRFEAIEEVCRGVLETGLELANVENLPDPMFTAYFQEKQQELAEDIDMAKLPKEYQIIESRPNKSLIKKDLRDGKEIDGAHLDNGGRTLVIRSK